jgi:hypothetical protein
MTIKEKLLNFLLRPFGLSVITIEDYENGKFDSEMLDRLTDMVNPMCEHGTRTNWCKACDIKRDEEAKKIGRY